MDVGTMELKRVDQEGQHKSASAPSGDEGAKKKHKRENIDGTGSRKEQEETKSTIH